MPYSVAFHRDVFAINLARVTRTAEMVAIVLVMNGGAPLGMDAIVGMIMRHFPRYGARIATQADGIDGISPLVSLDLLTTLRSYDFEFRALASHCRFHRGDIRFCLTESAARFILRNLLYPLVQNFTAPTPRPELLYGLPLELKFQIFEYILHFPKSGIVIGTDALMTEILQCKKPVGPRAVYLLSRDINDDKDLAGWSIWYDQAVRSPRDNEADTFVVPLPPVLALQHVDKTTRSICEKIFYSQSHFHVRKPWEWATLLRGLTPSRAALLRKVSMPLEPYHVPAAVHIFTALANIGVQSVGLLVNQKEWKHPRSLSRKKPLSYRKGQLEMVKGLEALLGMGSEVKIWIEGDWEEFAVWLRRKSQVKEVKYKGEVVTKKQ